jgi:hypothetical protein
MKQNSKFNPEIARILSSMEKKNRVVKTKIITKYQLSRTQYSNIIEENKNRGYHKTTKQKSVIKAPLVQRNKSETAIKSKYIENLESKQNKNMESNAITSRNNRSKMTMKKTALNLLMDKLKNSGYINSTSLDDHSDEKMFSTRNFNDKSRMTFGYGMQTQTLNHDRSALSPMHSNIHDTINMMKTGTSNFEFSGRLEHTQTSWLPIIDQTEFHVLPKIQTNRNERKPTCVFIQR